MLVPDIFCPTHPGPSAPVRRREGTGKLGGGAGQAPTSRQKSLPSWTVSAHSEQGVSVTVWYMPRRKGNQRGSGGGGLEGAEEEEGQQGCQSGWGTGGLWMWERSWESGLGSQGGF